MKKELFAACSGVIFAASLVAQPVTANDSVAKLNEKGQYCARVEVAGPAGLSRKKTICRTLAEWEAAGYSVSAKEE